VAAVGHSPTYNETYFLRIDSGATAGLSSSVYLSGLVEHALLAKPAVAPRPKRQSVKQSGQPRLGRSKS